MHRTGPDPPAAARPARLPCRTRALLLLLGVLAVAWTPPVTANSARMLPDGTFRFRTHITHFEADSLFDAGGERRSFRDVYAQGLAENGVPVDGGTAYRIDADGKLRVQRVDLFLEYGVTDDFNLGVWTRFFETRNSASASLLEGPDFASLSAAQRGGIRGAVSSVEGLDSSATSFGDTVVGFKHRLWGDNRSRFRFAYHGGLRLPTGHVADPLDPGDLSTGDGQLDAGLWLNFDYQPHPRFFFNLLTRHEYQFAGERHARDPSNPTRRLDMDFQPGFFNFAEFEARYTHPVGKVNLIARVLTTYFHQSEERRQSYDAATGQFTGALRRVPDTDRSSLTIQPMLGVSFLRMGIPVRATIGHGIPLTGVNVAASRSWQLRIDVFF